MGPSQSQERTSTSTLLFGDTELDRLPLEDAANPENRARTDVVLAYEETNPNPRAATRGANVVSLAGRPAVAEVQPTPETPWAEVYGLGVQVIELRESRKAA